jgi:nitrogen-specific signal transduction histidine kinase
MTSGSAEARALARELDSARTRIAALETELAEARRLESLGRLTRSIAHDFSNVVAAISGYNDLISEALPADGMLRRRVEAIHKATEWGQRLAHELVAAGRPRAEEAPVADLNTIVGGVVRTLGPLLGAGIEVATELDPDVGAVAVGAGPLEQVTMNLLLNARDAMPFGGRVTVCTARAAVNVDDRPSAVLRVADTGIGMDEATRARVFEPYFTTKPAGKGTGLGLSTVFGIVTQHGGHIDVASEPGRGATFTLTLPRVGMPQPAAAAGAAPPTVLVIEREPSVRDLIVEILELHAFRALAARDHREAQRVSAEHAGPLALVIADAGEVGAAAPQIDRLRAARPETRVLYLSGALDDARREAEGSTLAKPFTVDALVRKVREVLGQFTG